MTIITIVILIIAVLYVCMGYFKGVADTIQHSEEYRLNGWKAKWKLDAECEPVLERGKMVEKFPFSSTMLVFLTDKWHFTNFMQYRMQDGITCFLILGITHSCWGLIAFIVLPLLRYTGFKITYRRQTHMVPFRS